MTMLFERDMVQTRGGTKTYSKEKSELQKINDLCMVGYGRDLYELLRPNKTINSEVYSQQLDRVNECLKEKGHISSTEKELSFTRKTPVPMSGNDAAKNKGTELGNVGPPAIFTGLGTIRLPFIQIIAKAFK
jgi:hypothetical protein